MRKALVALVAMVALVLVTGGSSARSALQSRILLLSGLGEPSPDAAWQEWTTLFGTTAVIGKPNVKATSISAYSSSVRAEIREAFQAAGREKIGVVAHSIAATAVLEAILKDKSIREDVLDRVVLISPLVTGVDSEAQDIGAILSFSGMSPKLEPAIEKGSAYFDSLNTLIKKTAIKIENNPELLQKYPKTLIITSKDDGMIPMSASNPTSLPFIVGFKIRQGLRHGRFVTGMRPILDIKNAKDPVYRLARLFLDDNDAWDTIGREVGLKDRGEVILDVKGGTAYLIENFKTTQLALKQNASTGRYYLEGLESARYHVFVDGDDGGEFGVGPAQFVNSVAPLPGAQPPKAVLHATPSSGPVPLAVSFDASNSTDTDGEIVSWKWQFGDNSNATGAAIVHTYQHEGNFTCTLTVTDDDDLTDSVIKLISVTGPNTPPTASFLVTPTQGDTNTTFVFNGSASSDPDGQIASYSWDFGDQSAKASGSTTTHTYTTNGTYTAVLTVKDNKGASDTESATVRVSAPNQPPTAILSASAGGSENPLKIVVVLNASDSDGVVSSATIDFGEGGAISVTPGVAYFHIYGAGGSFTIVGTATDNSGATTTSNELKVYDVDGDKYANQYAGDIRGSDCNDSDATIHPGAIESPADHKDSNCNGLDDF